MKKLMIIAAAAALFAGCGSEAEKFGYKGADLKDDSEMFFSTGPTVTNWVPARVLGVVEKYPITEAEAAIIKEAGIIDPGAPLETIPEGYEKRTEEPWFTVWAKNDVEHFGFKGSNGFVAHYNDDKNVWETGETYFSSYYDDEAPALKALAKMRKVVAKGYAPKRFWDFDKCWVAEYVRIRVMCLVGQRADGKWSCMLDIHDKCRTGCGQWEPLDVQAERLAEHKYRKALAAWKEATAKAVAENHQAVEKVRMERGLELFGDESSSFDTNDGRKGYQRFGEQPAAQAETSRDEFWKTRVESIAKATGVAFDGEPAREEQPEGCVIWSLAASSDIYDARLDVAFPQESADETEQNQPIQWREICIEKVLPGFELPPRPQPPTN